MKKRKKMIIVAVSLALILGSSIPASYIYFTSKKSDALIFPGVKIEEIDVSGKTKEAATQIIQQKYGDVIAKKKITVKALDKSYSIEYSKLNAKYNVEETVKEAFQYGKNLNMFSKYKMITNPSNKEMKLKFTYDPKPIEEVVASIEKDVNKDASNARLTLVGGKFKITPDKKGTKLEKEKLSKEIENKISGTVAENVTIEAPIQQIKASIVEENLQNVDTKIASFSTDFSTSNENRSTNIDLSTRSINGKVYMPGETFSFNDVVGQRTVEKGYKEAGVIINNQLESGVGGGICQVSSTLYNAMLRANIKATERVHHTLASSYVPLGLDATVDFGNIDYKFKNTLEYPIYIEGYTANKNLYFNVYSNSSLNKKKYEITTDVYETIQPIIKETLDSTKPVGENEIIQKAYTGFRVKVYKNVYENGNLLNQELIYNDYYQPVNGEVKKGTKKIK